MIREKSRDKAEKSVTVSFVMTDEMAERLRKVLWVDRDYTKGKLFREAVHKFLLWREECNNEDLKLIRDMKGLKEPEYHLDSPSEAQDKRVGEYAVKIQKDQEQQTMDDIAKSKEELKVHRDKVFKESLPELPNVPGMEDLLG